MKRVLLCVTFVATLLCSCALPACVTQPAPTNPELVLPSEFTVVTQPPATTETPLPPDFGQAPELCGTTLVINGTVLPHCFMQEQTPYLCLRELAAVLSLDCTTTVGEGTAHSCTVQLPETSLLLTPNTGSAMEGRTVIALGGMPVFDGEDWYVPVGKLMSFLGFSELNDLENDTVYYTKYPRSDSIQAGKEIPVLMYHAVSDNCWGSAELFVSPSVLEEQIAALLENGYTPITFEDFDRLSEIKKPVMLTFDDGYDDNYSELFPILRKYQVKATVFMIVNDIGKNHKLTQEELTEMAASGLVSVQSHTMSHNYLSYMNEEQLDRELFESKLALAQLTGKEPFVLCYPTGMYSDLSLKKTAEYYEYGLLMSAGLYTTGEDPFMIRRFYVPRGLSAEGLLQKIG